MKPNSFLTLTPILLSLLFLGCVPDKPSSSGEGDVSESAVEEVAGNTGKGIGQVTQVTLHSPLEGERVSRGQAIFEMKCQACHRLDDQRVVGPGWKNITKTRKPEWIMNMITNVEVMLEKDEEAQKLLELCLTRMPNQNVSIGDARDILEFMRKNDGEQ